MKATLISCRVELEFWSSLIDNRTGYEIRHEAFKM